MVSGERVAVVLTVEAKAALSAMAKKEKRTLSQCAAYIIETHLEQEGYLKAQE